MRDWIAIFRGNKQLLSFGFLFSFFSSFGQTFFISLFVPFWIASIGISNAGFGSIYATITIIAAIIISFTGKYIDDMPLRKYSFIVFGLLIIAVLFLSQSREIISLTIGLFLVRWLGQGLMTHTSSTGIAKYFSLNRGKALSFSALGHPAGHFLLPILMLPLIALVGWRYSLIIIAVVAAAIMIPVILSIGPSKVPNPDSNGEPSNENSKPGNINYLKTKAFWIISFNIFIMPFVCTALFLYQYSIGDSRGWSISWVAFSFSFFAIFSALGLLFSGNLTDRYSGLFLFPVYLAPAIVGVLLAAVIDHKFIFPVLYALLGISSGLGSTVKTATQTELFGTGNLGKVRSYFSTILVLSTAIGPPVFGFLLDRAISFNLLMLFSGILLILSSLTSFLVWPEFYFQKIQTQLRKG
jgi:MFS family permease